MALQLQSCAQHRAVKSLLPIAWTSIGWPGRVTDPNRRVRTRMHGGVGGVGPRGLPLSRLRARAAQNPATCHARVRPESYTFFASFPGVALQHVGVKQVRESNAVETRAVARHALN